MPGDSAARGRGSAFHQRGGQARCLRLPRGRRRSRFSRARRHRPPALCRVPNLEGAFGRRAVTERAKGILMERHGVDEQRAFFELLRAQPRNRGGSSWMSRRPSSRATSCRRAQVNPRPTSGSRPADRIAADRSAGPARVARKAGRSAGTPAESPRASEERLDQRSRGRRTRRSSARSYCRYRHEYLTPWTRDSAAPAGGRARRRARRSRRSGRPGPERVHARVARRRRRDLRRRRRRARLVRGRGDARRGRHLRRPRVHRRAHAPGDVEAAAVGVRRLVLPLGTTAVVADPHEIANVLGTDGVHWLVDVCDDLPLDVLFTASSCVPASQFESPRRPFTPGDLESLLRRKRVIGLAEMMNFPGVISGRRASSRSWPSPAATTSTATRRASSAGPAGLRRRRDPLRPRGVHRRGGRSGCVPACGC